MQLIGDYEGTDIPSSINIPDKYDTKSITLGRWDETNDNPHSAGWDGRNDLRSEERRYVVIGNRQAFGDKQQPVEELKIVETFFHEVAAHQGVLDSLTIARPKGTPKISDADAHTAAEHSDIYARFQIEAATNTKSDEIAIQVNKFFGATLDRSLYDEASKAFAPAPAKPPAAKPAAAKPAPAKKP